MAAQLLWDAVTTFQGSTWNAELRPPCLSLSLLESLFKVLQALLWGDSEFSHQINEFWWVFWSTSPVSSLGRLCGLWQVLWHKPTFALGLPSSIPGAALR